jgi:hypothetical protein
MLNLDCPQKMFQLAVDNLKDLMLPDGYVFRGEFLNKPKHNVLAYDRVPLRNIIIYDIEIGDGTNEYMSVREVQATADMYGFEVVPTFHVAEFDNIMANTEMLDGFLDTVSILGGQKIEGVVIKCYERLDSDDKILMAKYVRPDFKEMNGGGANRPNKAAITDAIVAKFNTVARYEKAVQHVREDVGLLGEMKDIGPLMRELNKDFEDECADDVKDMLYKYYRKVILRGVTQGFPEWYKGKLLDDAANETVTAAVGGCGKKVMDEGCVTCPDCKGSNDETVSEVQ